MTMPRVGLEFGYRKQGKWALGVPLHPVLIVKEGPPKSYRYRVQWLDGEYEGLTEWARREHLVCPWDEVPFLMEDERRLLIALEASEKAFSQTKLDAFNFVAPFPLEQGHPSVLRTLVMIWNFPDELAEADAAFTEQEWLSEPLAFVDRDGCYWAPFGTGEKFAVRKARSCAADILAKITKEEREWREIVITGHLWRRTLHGGENRFSPERAKQVLAEQGPIWALVREWCGADAATEFHEVEALRAEVQRLRAIIKGVIGWMESSGDRHKAPWLKREATGLTKRLNGS